MQEEEFIFISNCKKGLSSTISTVFLSVFKAKYCQYISDNVQQQYRIKYKLLFFLELYIYKDKESIPCIYISF
jgi:hypothetical protein